MKVLVAIDFSESTGRLLSEVEKMTEVFITDLWLIHVVPPDPDFIGYEPGPQSVRDQIAEEYREEHRILKSKAEELQVDGAEIIPLLLQGSASETILEEADRLDVDMIIIGSHGHGSVYGLLVGSVSGGVLHKSNRPVLVVPVRPKS